MRRVHDSIYLWKGTPCRTPWYPADLDSARRSNALIFWVFLERAGKPVAKALNAQENSRVLPEQGMRLAALTSL